MVDLKMAEAFLAANYLCITCGFVFGCQKKSVLKVFVYGIENDITCFYMTNSFYIIMV